ncbi:DUF3093 domain-containing protein [Streptomyces durbertensis]|uniref:DUF3093 domain-containing protein n=1 Tax=Streptomyces durbertensis TaxID=2448886 RepID=A0ABR6EF47_9ACTN|nr:DUF3093 domain-containing protein [Streptomyces durbertensis]MBB1243878.1 DUF3093 domain-containing protein [Streptomyces durbertensis]
MQHYDERLTAPGTWWLTAALCGVGIGLTLLPLGVLPSLVGLVAAGGTAAAVVSVYGSARLRVVAGSLLAGDARVPVTALGEAEALDREESHAWRTFKADPRAFMLLRSYVPTAVRVEVVDPDDPTPYLYLSTRRPARLVAALEAARAESGHGSATGG